MIELKSLQKVVEQNTVLDIAEIHIPVGEVAAIIGPADSGKEQLIDLLLGKVSPTFGSLCFGSIDPVRQRDAFSRAVGVMFPDDGHYVRQTAEQNLAFHARLYGVAKPRIDEVLTLVGLADQGRVRAEKLSSGLARRLAFGRAILHKPQALILIEPFERCDETSLHLLARLIRQQAAAGLAVLILAGDNAHLASICDTIYQLNQGRVVETFKPQEEQAAALPFKIPVRLEGKVALINPVDILYADADEGKAALQTHSERWLTQFTLSELEERLARSGFFRAHRSYLVNLQHVKEVIPYTRNSFSLRLDDEAGTEIPLSKSAAAELRELLGY